MTSQLLHQCGHIENGNSEGIFYLSTNILQL